HGFAICDTARFIAPRVVTVIAGVAGGMGWVIAMAGEKEDRVALPNAKLLIHQPLVGGVIHGSASDLEIHARDIIELKKKMHRLYAERTGTPQERFVDLMERDRWIDPPAAIDLGLISKVVTSRKELDSLLNRGPCG